MGGARLNVGGAPSPHRAKSPSVKVRPASSSNVVSLRRGNQNRTQPLTAAVLWPQERSRDPEPEAWVGAGPPRDRQDGKKTAKLPETPKTAEEMWQHSVIGDYLAKYRVSTGRSHALRSCDSVC